MSALSLNKMSVAGSDGGSGNQGLLMPKLQYRFRVNFLNFGVVAQAGLSLTRQVVDVARPTVNFDQVTLPVYNSTIKLAGKHQWQDITCTIRDEATGEVAKAVGQQLQKQLDFMEQASAAAGQDYKFQTNIQILDGGNGTQAPAILETWELYGCWLRAANYQTLNYGQSDAVTIQLTICYDNAIQTPNDTGVGFDIGTRLRGSLATTPASQNAPSGNAA
jgi:hypothetical protein